MTTRPTPGPIVLIARGASGACPVCGQRKLRRGIANIVPECPQCGFVIERRPGHFVGAVGVSTVVTFFLILVALLGGIAIYWPNPTAVELAVAPMLIAIIVPVIGHPFAKTFWAGLDLLMHPLGPGEALGGFTADSQEGPLQ